MFNLAIEAIRAVKAPLQVLFTASFQIIPVVLGTLIFEWDNNIRCSTIMGFAGGLASYSSARWRCSITAESPR